MKITKLSSHLEFPKRLTTTYLNELYLQMCLDRQKPVKVSWTWKIDLEKAEKYIDIGSDL